MPDSQGLLLIPILQRKKRMVKTLLSLQELPQNDAADALGLAICHVHSNSLLAAEKTI